MIVVKVKCKRCGREYKSDEFVLDPVYKMMVCRECVRERKNKEFAAGKAKQKQEAKIAMETQIKQASQGLADPEIQKSMISESKTESFANKSFLKKEKPAGWDAEDSEIERAYKQKQAALPDVEKIDNERVKYTCKKCKYKFVFNYLKRVPGRCPYCGANIESV